MKLKKNVFLNMILIKFKNWEEIIYLIYIIRISIILSLSFYFSV